MNKQFIFLYKCCIILLTVIAAMALGSVILIAIGANVARPMRSSSSSR